MNRKQGFTLVELLVVMAIIAILAAIAIPNIQQYIAKGKATQAITEISQIELSITKMLSDAGRSNLSDLFDMGVMQSATGYSPGSWDDPYVDGSFEAFVELFTEQTYRLLRKGRGAVVDDDDPTVTLPYFNEEAVRNLGTNYYAELGFDPWGQLYRIYPGPWRATSGPNVFRIYLPQVSANVVPGDSQSSAMGDSLSLGVDSLSGFDILDVESEVALEVIGVPANNRQSVYIWSYGENLTSGQVNFVAPPDGYNPQLDPSPYASITPVTANYDTGQEPELMGGGDDINNWDKNSTFMRFYN